MKTPWVLRRTAELERSLHASATAAAAAALTAAREAVAALETQLAASRERAKNAEGVANRLVDECRALREAMTRMAERASRSAETSIRYVVELKKKGFEGPPPAPEVEHDPTLPSDVITAIAERAPPESPLARQLEKWAQAQLRGNEMSSTDVAERVLKGTALDYDGFEMEEPAV